MRNTNIVIGGTIAETLNEIADAPQLLVLSFYSQLPSDLLPKII